MVAGVHYMYMRECWDQVRKSPFVSRYVDWCITVPLQLLECIIILRAAGKATTAARLWKLLGTIVMLAFDFMG